MCTPISSTVLSARLASLILSGFWYNSGFWFRCFPVFWWFRGWWSSGGWSPVFLLGLHTLRLTMPASSLSLFWNPKCHHLSICFSDTQKLPLVGRPGTPKINHMSTIIQFSPPKDRTNGAQNRENQRSTENVILTTPLTPHRGFYHPKHLRN